MKTLKKLRISLIFLLIPIAGLTQNLPESSVIHIVRSKSFIGSGVLAEIVFPNQRAFGLPIRAQADFEIYSTGNIVVTCNWGISTTKQVSINVESNEEYYLLFDKGLFKETSKEEIQDHLDNVNNNLKFKESLDLPINKNSIAKKGRGPTQGTGFLINNQGYILTNFHVIENASTIKVTGIKGDFSVPFVANLVAIDRLADLALLKIESKLVSFDNPPYTLSDSKLATKAEKIFALGYPMEGSLGREVKITDGIINSLTGFKQSISEFQISASVQQGNSGGPLFNSEGKVIGIVSAKIRSDVADQVGYAIKSNYINFFLNEAGITQFSETKNQLDNISLSEQVRLISDFIYSIKTE